MKKILIFAGIILLCVLILSAWFFIGNLGNFTQFLGRESTEIFANEKSRFIGTWETNDTLFTYTFKSDGSFIYNHVQGTYEINENNRVLLIYGPDEESSSLNYSYQFSTDDTILNLYDVDTLEATIVLKKIQ